MAILAIIAGACASLAAWAYSETRFETYLGAYYPGAEYPAGFELPSGARQPGPHHRDLIGVRPVRSNSEELKGLADTEFANAGEAYECAPMYVASAPAIPDVALIYCGKHAALEVQNGKVIHSVMTTDGF